MMLYKRALVTGGTGFVGYHIARSLRENGLPVRALARETSSPSRVKRLKDIGVEVVAGDILEPGSTRAALNGISYVFHAAAIHKTWTNDPAAMYKVNVDATRHLLRAAVESGVEQFIYTSSIKTIGLLPGGALSDEQVEYNLWNIDVDYGRSKHLAERMLLAADERIEIKILNPAAVIGPEDESLTPTMALIARMLHSRIRAVLETRMGLVDARDVGYAHFLALSRAKPKQRYILCAANMTMEELLLNLCELTGASPRLVRIPYGLAYPIAYMSVVFAALTGIPPVVNPRSLNIARLRPGYCGTKAEKELGLRYRDIRATLKDTISWLKDRFSSGAAVPGKVGGPKV